MTESAREQTHTPDDGGLQEEASVDTLRHRRALRIACLLGGSLLLLVIVAVVSTPQTGGVLTLVAGGALMVGLWGDTQWHLRRALPHILAVVLAGMTILGLCASACGAYEAYESFLGLPTAVGGGALHVFIVLAIILDDRLDRSGIISDIAIALGIGGSCFYGTLLLVSGTWCGACVGIHMLMLIQLVDLLRSRDGARRLLPIAVAAAAALGVNAVYHHRLVPEVRNDAADLLAYLRSQRLGEPVLPARQVTTTERDAALQRLAQNMGVADRIGEAEQQGKALPNDLTVRVKPGVASSRSTPLPPSSVQPAAGPAGLRPASLANRWGSQDAPAALLVLLDTGCPACRAQFPQILELRDLVEKGSLQVRFLLTYRNEASQASATIGYAAGMAGEETLLTTLKGFYENQTRLLTPADVLEACPPGFPKAQALQIVSSQQKALTDLLADAVRLRDRLGTRVEPTLWLFKRGDGERPARVLTGMTTADVLRVAVANLGAANAP